MARFTVALGCAGLWLASLYPAARLLPILLLLLTPLAGMICDAPQTPCLRVLGGYYMILLSTIAEIVIGPLVVLVSFRASWKVALVFNALNWSLYTLVLLPAWRP